MTTRDDETTTEEPTSAGRTMQARLRHVTATHLLTANTTLLLLGMLTGVAGGLGADLVVTACSAPEAQQLALIGVLNAGGIAKLGGLAHIVQKNARQQQVSIKLRITLQQSRCAGQHVLGVLKQPAYISVVHTHRGWG